MTESTSRRWDHETMLVVWLAGAVALISFFSYLRDGDVLLYGDAVAHINIARRVFDSRTPGLLQLGTVWLPLPHLLMIPFLLSDGWWQSGIGGSIPSLMAFLLGAAGIFRLVRGALGSDFPEGERNPAVRVAAWMAAAIYVANPNLIYLQATAMTEALYLGLFLWAVVHFSEFVRALRGAPEQAAEANSSLVKCGLCLVGACLTRYDGWFLAAAMGGAALLVGWKSGPGRKGLGRGLAKFILLAAAAPVFWIAYNGMVYQNPLEFANGPYSALAIELRTSQPGSAPHPGSRNLAEAAAYFLKAAELNLASGNWGRLWVGVGVAGLILGAAGGGRSLWPLLMLGVPFPFYMLSIAYGGVPIFLPVWWPYSLYNARYGVQLLPAFAVAAAIAAYFAARLVGSIKAKALMAGALVIFVAGSYASVWWRQPVSFREAWNNSRTRQALEKALASTLEELPPNATFLMYLGDHVGALEIAGIPLRRVIYEGNHRTWKRPSDPQGLWERALADPPRYVDFVVASDGDALSIGMERQGLEPLLVIHVTGQPRVVLYRARGGSRPATP
jgi:hypothetical protein